MSTAFVVIVGCVEYSTLLHLSDEMMWYIPHHAVWGKARVLIATKCYEVRGLGRQSKAKDSIRLVRLTGWLLGTARWSLDIVEGHWVQ